MEKKRDGGHRHNNSVLRTRFLEIANGLVAFLWRRIDGNQIVVVQIHSPGANLGQHRNDFCWGDDGSHEIAEWIAATISHGP